MFLETRIFEEKKGKISGEKIVRPLFSRSFEDVKFQNRLYISPQCILKNIVCLL